MYKIYRGRRIPGEVIEEGRHLRIDYAIYTLGTHPTAYVRVPRNHRLYKVFYDTINEEIDRQKMTPPHGWLTFSGELPEHSGYWIGWDYAHVGDSFDDHLMTGSDYLFSTNRQWTLREIKEDVKTMVKNLIILREEVK